MSFPQRQLAALVPLLLVLTASELALNRLAVPALRVPTSDSPDAPPPLWHQVLDHTALFLQYFTTCLAIAIVALYALAFLRRREALGPLARYALAASAASLAGLAVIATASPPGETLTFWFETSFTALVVLVALSQLRRGGSLAAKLGVALIALTQSIHYLEPLASRTAAGREALWLGLPDQIQFFGQWSVVLVALASPYLFAPKPAARALIHPFPGLLSIGVAAAGAFLLSYSYEVATIVASSGLGLDLGPGAPTSHLALYVLALGSIGWTTIACLIAPAPARRRLGGGLALVVASGYAFAWPLYYLTSAVGLIAIWDAARDVKKEEIALLAYLRGGSNGAPEQVGAEGHAPERQKAGPAASASASASSDGDGDGDRDRDGDGQQSANSPS